MPRRLLLALLGALALLLSLAGPASAAGTVSNGRVIWVNAVNQGSGDLWVENRDGTGLHQLTTGGGYSYVRWSPAGTRLLVVRHDDQIQIRTASGAFVRNLAQGAAASWSPDGRSVAFVQGRSLFRVAAAGGMPTRLLTITCDMGAFAGVDWSPRGDRLYLSADCKTNSFDRLLWTYKLGTGKLTPRSDDDAQGINSVRWMPDGTHITFVSYCAGPTNSDPCLDGQENVYVADVTTDNRVAQTQLHSGCRYPDDCLSGYNEVAPAPDGHDFAVTYRSHGGASTTACIKALVARMKYCSDTYTPISPDWARAG